MPVSFRYTVAPLTSMKTFVFKPSPPDGGGNAESVRAASLGCYYAGNYQKVIRNKTASLIWEAACRVEFLDNKVAGIRKKISNARHASTGQPQVEFSTSPAKVQIVKPKIFLLCGLVIPAKSAVRLNSGT